MILYDLGLYPYEQAWILQDQLAERIFREEHPECLLLLEHPHTYTFGRRGQAENLLWDLAELDKRKVSVHWVDRGGDVTYHGPGQLVGYPLLSLGLPDTITLTGDGKARLPQADYVGYVRKLEKVLISALAELGLAGGQIPGMTGVWVQADIASRCPRCRPEDRQKPAKIGAIGVKVDARGITRHGFALNVDPDMSYWEGIIACGIADYPVVSLADVMRDPPSMEAVKAAVLRAFEIEFEVKLRSAEPTFG